MIVSKEQRDGIVVLGLDGDVMGGPEASRVNEEINSFLDEGSLKVVMDLGGVNRMNSSGLGIMINALTTFQQNGGSLKLARVSPVVQNLLKITRLDSIFDSFDSVEDALGSF